MNSTLGAVFSGALLNFQLKRGADTINTHVICAGSSLGLVLWKSQAQEWADWSSQVSEEKLLLR